MAQTGERPLAERPGQPPSKTVVIDGSAVTALVVEGVVGGHLAGEASDEDEGLGHHGASDLQEPCPSRAE